MGDRTWRRQNQRKLDSMGGRGDPIAPPNDGETQFNLGLRIFRAAKSQNEFLSAADLIGRAAETGYAQAQAVLGFLYQAGIGINQDVSQAVVWYRKAAIQFNAEGQFGLAMAYNSGTGVRTNDEQAAALFLKAARQGHRRAQFELGRLYESGIGVAPDDLESVKWHMKAAKQGDEPAQYKVALAYYVGRGVQQDYGKADFWFRKYEAHVRIQDVCEARDNEAVR